MTTPPTPPPVDPIRALRDVIEGAIRDNVTAKVERRGGVSDPILSYVKSNAYSIMGDAAQRVRDWYATQRPADDSTWSDAADAPLPVAALRTKDGNEFDPVLREAIATAIRRYPNDRAEGWIGPEAVLNEVEKFLGKSRG